MGSDVISILISSYNHSKYITECIQSIIKQTYKNIELIIVDDCSSDDTRIKIRDVSSLCQKRFTRFIYSANNKNQGIIEVQKTLHNLSKGKFLFKLASDDFLIDDNAINTLYNFLKNNKDYKVAVCDNYFVDSNSKKCFVDRLGNISYKKEVGKYNSFINLTLSNRSDVNVNLENFGSYKSISKGNYITNGLLINRNIYNKIEFYNKHAPLEDWFLLLQIAKFYKLKFIRKPMYCYRKHQTNSSNNKWEMKEKIRQTIQYEWALLELPRYKKYKKIAQEFYTRKIINIPFVLKLTKQKNFYHKRMTISLFGIKIYQKLY